MRKYSECTDSGAPNRIRRGSRSHPWTRLQAGIADETSGHQLPLQESGDDACDDERADISLRTLSASAILYAGLAGTFFSIKIETFYSRCHKT